MSGSRNFLGIALSNLAQYPGALRKIALVLVEQLWNIPLACLLKHFLLLFNYSRLHFLPIPPPHPGIHLLVTLGLATAVVFWV